MLATLQAMLSTVCSPPLLLGVQPARSYSEEQPRMDSVLVQQGVHPFLE